MVLDNEKPRIGEHTTPSEVAPSPWITDNLKPGLSLRPYQKEALIRFDRYWRTRDQQPQKEPVQLLYHMATGSGKTLIMAGLILDLYTRGYRNFMFFVNSTNILQKTRDNFLDPASSKYLFADRLMIDGRYVRLKETTCFDATAPHDISIVFTTIQGLHSGSNTPAENSVTYEDLEEKRIVMISDEAHHINAETKRKSELAPGEREELISWESTVRRILHANRENVLLEFTATADLTAPEIARKYRDKLIFDYPLKQFRKDGYSKEVRVLQTTLPPMDRALQAAILSQYRRKLFEKYRKRIKPVILFKSRTIKESLAFYEAFILKVKDLNIADLERIRDQQEPFLEKAFAYLKENEISLENFALELQEDLSPEKLLSVNSKDDSEQKQLAVNSLEDEANEYRGIFAVDKLNEGWDVLNLFDIVRLYDTGTSRGGKSQKTTVTEAQLIGRGARYCPFRISEDQPHFERKFDNEPEHELRVCEELYYHCGHDPQYIQELDTAMVEIGIKAGKGEERIRKPSLRSRSQLVTRIDPKKLFIERTYGTGSAWSKKEETNAMPKEAAIPVTEFEMHVLRKAINTIPEFRFNNLKYHFPELTSISEFIASPQYLGSARVQMPAHMRSVCQQEIYLQLLVALKEIAVDLGLDRERWDAT